MKLVKLFVMLSLVCLPIGCDSNQKSAGDNQNASDNDILLTGSDEIVFQESVATNREIPENLEDLEFKDKNGDTVSLKEFVGKKNVILVFTKGFDGTLCPFCTTQTSRLIANYDRFVEQNAEVVVVYPGDKEKVEEFVEAALNTEKQEVDKVPFPILLDEDLKATDFFDIRGKYAKPSTFIIDKNGGVQLAYVGSNLTSDRPSIKAMLEILKRINK